MVLTNINKGLMALMCMFVMVLGFQSAEIVISDDDGVHAVITDPKTIEPTPGTEDQKLITKMLNVARVFAGFVLAISVIVVVYGGLKYVLSQGDSRAAEQGKMLIIYAGIGIFISLSAFIIVKMFQGFA